MSGISPILQKIEAQRSNTCPKLVRGCEKEELGGGVPVQNYVTPENLLLLPPHIHIRFSLSSYKH